MALHIIVTFDYGLTTCTYSLIMNERLPGLPVDNTTLTLYVAIKGLPTLVLEPILSVYRELVMQHKFG